MATREYLESQHFDVTLGATVYEVTVSVGGSSIANFVHPTLTATDGDDTPSVLAAEYLLIPENTGATAITQLANAVAYQCVTIIATHAGNPSTIANSGNFTLSANWTPGIGDTITLFTTNGTAWTEISRSNN